MSWVRQTTQNANHTTFIQSNKQVKGLVGHLGRVMHKYVSKLTIIGSNNGLSPSRHQPIIWTNARILLFVAIGTNFNEILI